MFEEFIKQLFNGPFVLLPRIDICLGATIQFKGRIISRQFAEESIQCCDFTGCIFISGV